jgi:hypothetical protein
MNLLDPELKGFNFQSRFYFLINFLIKWLGLLFVSPWFKPYNKGLFLVIIMCRATPKKWTNSRLKILLIKFFYFIQSIS